MNDLSWLRSETKRQQLDLSDEDLLFIQLRLESTKAALLLIRPLQSDGLEPPYCFAPKPKDVN